MARMGKIAALAAPFPGFVMVADASRVLWQKRPGTCPSGTRDEIVLCHPRDPAQLTRPWASVTKQVVAVLVMQEVERGRLQLDAPASRWLPTLEQSVASPTIRQLLQHRAGLRNPEDSPKDASGLPSFYVDGGNGGAALDWCLGQRGPAGGNWRYNNCDYLILGAILEKASGRTLPALFAERIARPLALDHETRFLELGDRAGAFTRPLEDALAARYGAAGGLVGPANDLLAIDRALLAGRLLTAESRALLWNGDPKLGFMALGQWAFSVPLTNCARPVRIIERRGAIGRIQVRNILLPEGNLAVIVFIDDAGFDFGEIWQGRGFSHDLLAAAAC